MQAMLSLARGEVTHVMHLKLVRAYRETIHDRVHLVHACIHVAQQKEILIVRERNNWRSIVKKVQHAVLDNAFGDAWKRPREYCCAFWYQIAHADLRVLPMYSGWDNAIASHAVVAGEKAKPALVPPLAVGVHADDFDGLERLEPSKPTEPFPANVLLVKGVCRRERREVFVVKANAIVHDCARLYRLSSAFGGQLRAIAMELNANLTSSASGVDRLNSVYDSLKYGH
jgi:hypothetical protein